MKKQEFDTDAALREEFRELASEKELTEAQRDRLLCSIHGRIQERRLIMKRGKSGKLLLAAVILAVLGAGTAMGAGKIAFLRSRHSVNAVDYQTAEAVRNSELLGGRAKAVEHFADGTSFEKGYYMEVEACDDQGNKMGSYPEISVQYGGGLNLSICDPLEELEAGREKTILTGSFDGIEVEVETIEYLFLPPDAAPSAEDQKLEKEGKLYISYGSAGEERRTWMGALWKEDGLSYNLFTMKAGVQAEELLEKAGEIICSE